jgi:hypothetical protein
VIDVSNRTVIMSQTACPKIHSQQLLDGYGATGDQTQALLGGYGRPGQEAQSTLCPKELAFTGGHIMLVGGIGILLIVIAVATYYASKSR